MSSMPYKLLCVSSLLRLLPAEVPGKARLAKLLLGSCLGAQDVEVRGRYGLRFVVPSLREPIGFHLLVDGVYERGAVEFVFSRLNAGSVFVDVGANIGVFTLPAARKVGSDGCVLAIEPSPAVFPYLKGNVALNGLSNVLLERCVAFDHDADQVAFYEAPVEYFGMGSLASQFHDHPISVRARTLDHILSERRIRRVDLLKVDVEGFEAAVFRGAKQLLTGEDPPLILFEFCDWAEARVPQGKVGDAQRVLCDYSYRIQRLADFARNRGKPLDGVIVEGGCETLVAVKA